VTDFPFFTTFYLTKAAILSFYLEIFPTYMHIRRIILWTAIAYASICYIVTISLNAFLCFPVKRNWYAARTLSLTD